MAVHADTTDDEHATIGQEGRGVVCAAAVDAACRKPCASGLYRSADAVTLALLNPLSARAQPRTAANAVGQTWRWLICEAVRSAGGLLETVSHEILRTGACSTVALV